MRRKSAFVAYAIAFTWIAWNGVRFEAAGQSASKTSPGSTQARDATKPVEGDTQQFMKYLCEPTFYRLKQSLAVKPESDESWKAVTSDSLILAEAGNLLLMRSPGDEYERWGIEASALRSLGSQLYRSAKERDYLTVLLHYRNMVQRCNACHRSFAAGEHQLEP